MIGTNDNAAANDGEVMTLEEAAALCRVSRDVVYRLAASGSIPCRRVGAQWRFLRSQVMQWLASPPSNEASAASSTCAPRGLPSPGG